MQTHLIRLNVSDVKSSILSLCYLFSKRFFYFTYFLCFCFLPYLFVHPIYVLLMLFCVSHFWLLLLLLLFLLKSNIDFCIFSKGLTVRFASKMGEAGTRLAVKRGVERKNFVCSFVKCFHKKKRLE